MCFDEVQKVCGSEVLNEFEDVDVEVKILKPYLLAKAESRTQLGSQFIT